MVLRQGVVQLVRSSVFKNSFWGLLARILQTIFLSLFFIILSRKYSSNEFAEYLIAATVYQFMVGISSMGLGTWFVREYAQGKGDESNLIQRFLKIQILLGSFFYGVSVFLVFLLYDHSEIRLISIVLGLNIVFDNLIYGLNSVNIAQDQQRKSATILAFDGLLRFLIATLLYFYSFSVLWLSCLLVISRLLSLNVFLRIGLISKISVASVLRFKVSFKDLQQQIISNWRFVMIVGISLIFWRSATIIISKWLTYEDVSNYEIGYKVFSIFNIFPVIILSTIFSRIVRVSKGNDIVKLRRTYKKLFFLFAVFSFFTYLIVFISADHLIPLVFGSKHMLAAASIKEMFLTYLLFPIVLLQANFLIAMGCEKIDMYFNIIALMVFFSCSFVGLIIAPSLKVINYSIFFAFLAFNILQSWYLIKIKVTGLFFFLSFYISFGALFFLFHYTAIIASSVIAFWSFFAALFFLLYYYVFYIWKRDNTLLKTSFIKS